MANVFAILTAIVLAVSAFLAYKNYEAYSSDDPVAPGIIQQRQEQEDSRAKQQRRLTDLQDELKTTNESRVGTEKTAGERAVALKEQEKKNEELKAKIAENERKITENKDKIADMEDRLKETGDIKDLVSELKRLKTEIAQREAGIDEDTAKMANLTANIKGTQAIIDDFKTEQSNHVNKISYCRETRIRSVFGSWGFVTLSKGNNGGVVQGSYLDVVRDGDTIAKLYVTAVETTGAAAEVVPDSLRKDTVLMVGDNVEPAQKEAAGPAPAKGASAPALEPAAPEAPELPPEPEAPEAPPEPEAPEAPPEPEAPEAPPEPEAPASDDAGGDADPF